jgi:hypothetical protein
MTGWHHFWRKFCSTSINLQVYWWRNDASQVIRYSVTVKVTPRHDMVFKHVSLLKSSIFWDITPRSPLKVNRRFSGTFRLHVQCSRVSGTSLVCCLLCADVLLDSLWPWRLRRHVPPKCLVYCHQNQTTRCYIPEDITHHNCRRKNLLKSYISSVKFFLCLTN